MFVVGGSLYRLLAVNQQRNIDAPAIASCGSAYSISKYQFQAAESQVILGGGGRGREGQSASLPSITRQLLCPADNRRRGEGGGGGSRRQFPLPESSRTTAIPSPRRLATPPLLADGRDEREPVGVAARRTSPARAFSLKFMGVNCACAASFPRNE